MCFSGLIYVVLGSIYTNGTDGQIIQAEKLFLNKLYFDSDGGYDIGLIKLKKNAKLGNCWDINFYNIY